MQTTIHSVERHRARDPGSGSADRRLGQVHGSAPQRQGIAGQANPRWTTVGRPTQAQPSGSNRRASRPGSCRVVVGQDRWLRVKGYCRRGTRKEGFAVESRTNPPRARLRGRHRRSLRLRRKAQAHLPPPDSGSATCRWNGCPPHWRSSARRWTTPRSPSRQTFASSLVRLRPAPDGDSADRRRQGRHHWQLTKVERLLPPRRANCG